MFHVKHREAFKHRKTQPCSPIQRNQGSTKLNDKPWPIQHSFVRIHHTHPIKQASWILKNIYGVKANAFYKTQLQAQKISFASITHVPRETQQLNKLQQPTTFHVKHQPPTTNREETTLSNNQPANRSTPQCFTWNATTRSINSPLQLRQLMFHVKPKPETKIPLQQHNYFPPTSPSK